MESLLKEKLFETGYISFNLKDFDEKLYDVLTEDFPINELVPQRFENLRASIIELKRKSPYKNNTTKIPFEELEIIKEDILENYNDGINNSVDQIWYWTPPIVSNKSFNGILQPLMQYFYDYDMKECQSDITMYNDGCYLLNHKDAQNEITERKGHCVILIYLSTDYETGKGGELIIGNDLEVEPIFGNVAIMDFTKHNPEHAVRKVNGYNRFCYINFC
jgi:Rps23 Pro-64 3,4-dihydroxylase Tpa1-like proline 4-hydroxylase